jgi:tRNA(adenine34) deaminase
MTDSTHPPKGLFSKNASTIARVLATKKVSRKGLASGMRMRTISLIEADEVSQQPGSVS